MPEYSFYRVDDNRIHHAQAPEARETPATQVPEGHQEEEEGIDFNEDAILQTGLADRRRCVLRGGRPDHLAGIRMPKTII